MSTVLIASVGGSPAPVARAITDRRPAFTLFVATAREGGRPGSASEVAGILERAQAARLPHEILIVPPDDPEAIFLTLREGLRNLAESHPKARLVFDYTGGTKSMTSALFQAALATAGADLQFMAGRRDSLDRVTDGTERATRIPVDWLLAERTEARLRAAWKSFAYAECATGIAALLDDLGTDEKAPPAAKQRLRDLADAAEGFDLWDRFRHAEATQILARLAARHPDLAPFSALAGRCRESEAQRIADLWRNAERCAKRRRYDDAVARLYRLLEWTAQWRLLEAHGIDTGEVRWELISEEEVRRADIRTPRGNRTLSGLTESFRLLATKEPGGEFARFLDAPFPGKKGKTGLDRLHVILALRNKSILAHGASPLAKDDWDRCAAYLHVFLASALAPMLRAAGADPDPPQLPDTPPDTF